MVSVTRILLLAFVLFLVSVDARRSRKVSRTSLPSPEVCANVQSFEHLYKYTYSYDAIAETRNLNLKLNPNQFPSGIRIKCDELVISVPNNCMGVLKVSDCETFQGRRNDDGSLIYDTPQNSLLNKLLKKNPTYFEFNQGVIGKIFVDQTEPTDIINIKRAMLTALQLKFRDGSAILPLSKRIKVSEVSIFGTGEIEQFVSSYRDGYPREVNIERNMSKLHLPWSQTHSSYIHSPSETVTDALVAVGLREVQTRMEEATQSCKYILERGRRITEATCVETRNVMFPRNTFLQPLLGDVSNNKLSTALVTLNVKFIGVEKMDKSDFIRPIEIKRFRGSFKPDTLMFEEQWQKANAGEIASFNVMTAIENLVTQAADEMTPVLFSRVARHMAQAQLEDVSQIWTTISGRFMGAELEKATTLWVKLLHRCTSTSNMCYLRTCEPNVACMTGLASFISTTGMHTWTPQIKAGILNALGSIEEPGILIVRSTMGICRAQTELRTVLTLGKVLANHIATCAEDSEESIVIDALQFMRSQLNSDCTIQQGKTEHESIMLAVMNMLAVIPDETSSFIGDVFNCAANFRVPKAVSLAAVRALKNMQISDNEQVRTQILSIFSDSRRPSELRIACYLFLLSKEPTQSEVNTIVETAMDEQQPRSLRFFIKENIKSQVQLRETAYCRLSEITITRVTNAVHQFHLDLGFDWRQSTIREQPYSMRRSVFVPYLERDVTCNFKSNLIFTSNSVIPILANISVTAEVMDKNVTILETLLDVGGIMSSIEPLFGANGIFPDQGLQQFLQLPAIHFLDSEEWWPVSTSEASVLSTLQDEASMAYTILSMQNRSPVQIRMLNIPVDLTAIVRSMDFRNINIMDLIKMLSTLEEGKTIKSIMASQVLFGAVANPTSIGAPNLIQHDTSYYHDVGIKIIAEIKQLFFTGQGQISVEGNPDIRVTSRISNLIELPEGLACGSGYQLSTGHNSNFNASLISTATNIKVNLSPLPRSTELFVARVNVMTAQSGGLEVVEHPNVCQPRCWLGNCQTGLAISYKDCLSPLDIGLFINSNSDNYYQTEMSWGAMRVLKGRVATPCSGLEIKVNRKPSPTSPYTPVMRCAIKYVPDLQELVAEWQMGQMISQPWTLSANAFIYRKADQLAGYFASMNMTRPDGSVVTRNYVQVNKLTEKPEPWFAEIMGFVIPHEESAVSPRYTVTSEISLPLVGDISTTGMLEIPTTLGYKAHLVMKQGILKNTNAKTLFQFNVTSEPTVDGDYEGYNTKLVMANLGAPALPYSAVKFLFYSARDQPSSKARTSIHYEVVPLSGPAFFINSFTQYAKLEASRNVPFVFNTTLTSNAVQLQVDNYFANMSHILSENRIHFPLQPLVSTQMLERQAARIGKEIDVQSKMHKFYMEMYRDIGGDVFYSLSSDIVSQKPYSCMAEDRTNYALTFSLKPSICKYCYEVALNIPSAQVNSHWRMDGDTFDHQLSVDLHQATYPVFSYLPSMLYSQVDDRLKLSYVAKYTSINDNTNELELGYSYAESSFNILATATNLFELRTPRIFNALVSCNSCLPMTTFNTNFTIRHISGLTPIIEVPPKTRNDEFLLVLTHTFVNGPSFNTVARVFTSTLDNHLLDLRTSISMNYPLSRTEYTYLSWPAFDYRISMNSTLENVRTYKADRRDDFLFSIDVELGETVNAYRGRVSLGKQDPICPTQEGCNAVKVDISKVSSCGPKTPNCARLVMDLIGTPSVYTSTVLITGRDDITTALNILDLKISRDAAGTRASLDFEMSEAQLLLPRFMRGNISSGADVFEVNFVTDSTRLRWQRSLSAQINEMELKSTWNPLSVDCSATVTMGSTFEMNIPRCSISHPLLPSGKVIVQSNVVSRSMTDNQVRVQLTTDAATILDVTYTRSGMAHTLNYDCGAVDDLSSPCHIAASLNYPRVRVQSRIQSSVFNHTCTADLVLTSLLQNTITTQNSAIILGYPSELVASLSYPTVGQLSMDLSAIISGVLNKEIRIRNSRLESVEMRSMRPVYSPICGDNLEWLLTYTLLNAGQHDFVWNLSIGRDTTLATALYLGPNSPDVAAHESNLPVTARIYHALFNFTKCSSNVLFHLKNVNSNTDLLKSEMRTNVNVWPFVSTASWSRYFGSVLPYTVCPMCLGEISMNYEYNNVDASPTTLSLNAMHAQTRQLNVQYSVTTDPTTDETAHVCQTVISWPHSITSVTPKVTFTTNYSMNPSGTMVLKERIATQGMPGNALEISEDLTIDNNGLSHELKVVRNNAVLDNVIVLNTEMKRFMIRFPDPEQPTTGINITVRNGEVEVRDCTVMLPFSRSQLLIERVQFNILRDTLNTISGVRMANLKLTVKDTATMETISFTGKGQILMGGECSLNLQDTANKYVRIVMSLEPGVPATARSDIMLNLPMMTLSFQSNTQFSPRIIVNNFSGSMELMHPTSRKMVPVCVISNNMTMHMDMDSPMNARWVVELDVTPIWMHSTPMKYSHMISVAPTSDNTANAITVIVNWQKQQKISAQIKIANECWMQIPLPSDSALCIPMFASANGMIDLPMLGSNFDLRMDKTHLFSNFTIDVMMWHAPTTRMATIWRCEDLLDMQRTSEQNMFTGTKMFSVYTRWPIETTCRTTLNIVPTGTGNTYTWTIGTMDPIIEVEVAPISGSPGRTVTIHAVGRRQILTADVVVGTCIETPSTFSWLCIPSQLALRRINTDIPTVDLLRIVPIMRVVLPETPALDITLRDSSVVCRFSMEDDTLTMITDTVVNSPHLTQSLTTHSTVRVGPGEWFCSLTSNMWKGNLKVTINPMTTAMMMKANLETPWLLANINYTSPRILRVNDCGLMLKTAGTLATYIPININYHYTYNPDDNNWSINLRSCIFPSIMGSTNNVSLSVDQLMEDFYFHWGVTSETSDLINQLIDLRLQKTEVWKLVAGVSNILFWVKTDLTFDRSNIISHELVFGLPDQDSGIQFLTSSSVDANEKFIMKWFDSQNRNYLCRVSTVEQSWGTLVFNCFKIQERTAHTSMQDLLITTFRLDTRFLLGNNAPLRYWINLAKSLKMFDIRNLLDEKWLGAQCIKKLQISDSAPCISLSQNWVHEINRIIENTQNFKVDSLMCFLDRNNLYTPLSSYYSHMASILSHSLYVENIMAYNSVIQDTVMSWTNGMLTCQITNSTDQVAIHCDITCASCGPMAATIELIMKLDAEGRPIANLTATMPFITSYIVYNYGLPIKPVTCGMRTTNNEMSALVDWNISEETGFSSLTTTWNLMDKGIKCNCPKDESVILGITCTCHTMENGIVTEQEIHLPRFLQNFASSLSLQTPKSFSLEEQINKYFTDGPLRSYLLKWGNDLFTYYKSILQRYPTNNVGGIRIPIWKWTFGIGSWSLFADVDMTSFGVIMDTNSAQYPDLTQEVRIDIKDTEAGVTGRISMRNNFFLMTTDIDTSTLSYIGSSLRFPGSTESVTLSKVPGAIKMEFNDVEGSHYTCMITRVTATSHKMMCTVMTTGSTTPTPVSDATMQDWWFNSQQIMARLPMAVMEVYSSAINPALLKKHIQKTFHVTNMHSLDVVCDYISERSNELITYLRNKYVATNIEMVTQYLQLDEVPTDIVNQIMSVPELIEYLTGQSSLERILMRNVEEVFEDVFNYAIKIHDQYMEVYNLARSMTLYNLDFPTIPYIEINIRNCINWFTTSVEKCNDLMFITNEMICKPRVVVPRLYINVNYQDVLDYLVNLVRSKDIISRMYEINPLHHNQVIDFQQKYHEFPKFQSDCTHVASMDIVDNSFAIFVKSESVILALPKERVAVEFNLEREVYLLKPDNSRVSIELPYFSDVLDIQVNRKQILCRTSSIHVRLTFSDNQPSSSMQEVMIQKPYNRLVAGSIGAYSNLYDLPSMMIPDGSQATDLSQFANSYEISRLSQCFITMQDIPDHSTTPNYCEGIFSTVEMRRAAQKYPDIAEAYRRACSESCVRPEETCWFTRTFAAQLRSMGYPMNITSNCLLCNHEETPVASNEVYILMSLSKEMDSTAPVKLLNRMIVKVLKSINEQANQDTKIGLVSYGGKGSFYHPMMTTIQSKTLISDIDLLKNRVRLMNFDGPRYVSSSTRSALNFIHKQIVKSPSYVTKTLVVFTPEPEELSCKSLDLHIVDSLNEQLTSVLLWSPVVRMNDNNIILRTNDVCKTKSGGSSRVADMLSDHIVAKSNSRVQCHCYVTNNYTGAVKNVCMAR